MTYQVKRVLVITTLVIMDMGMDIIVTNITTNTTGKVKKPSPKYFTTLRS